MNNQLRNTIIVVLLAVVAVLVIALIPKQNDDNDENLVANVTNFITCKEAGYPVQESFPEQCRTPDGRVFTDEINEQVEVVIETPARNAVVTSPLTVSGKARGTWFFEANLPVTLRDANDKVLAQVGAQAQGEWMTEDFVNFTAVLNFATPETDTGKLIIEKDNPSGLPEHAGQYAIPVRFR